MELLGNESEMHYPKKPKLERTLYLDQSIGQVSVATTLPENVNTPFSIFTVNDGISLSIEIIALVYCLSSRFILRKHRINCTELQAINNYAKE